MFDAKKLLDMLVSAGSGTQVGGKDLGSVIGQVGSVVGQVLGQAQAGVGQAAGQINQATGIKEKAEAALQQATGASAGDLIAKAKDYAANNKMATGAAIGGLAAILLGTGAGRAITGTAARMGGMALIGGLAYKALQNYQAGKPLLDLNNAASDIAGQPAALPAPAGQEQTLRLVRAMIAAASADGVVDETERAAILGNLRNVGLNDEAAAYIENELANPADVSALADGVSDPNEGAQIYAAARLAIDPDTQEEQDFLAALASALSLEEGLVAHIDAAASSAKG